MLKIELRQKYKVIRQKLTENESQRINNQIFDQFIDSFDFSEKNISIFLPIEKFNEPNTKLIIKHLLKKNRVYVPVSNFENHTIQNAQIDTNSTFTINSYGIPEPRIENSIPTNLLDVVFVPFLTLNPKGYRVGYGKGFYDRFLSECNSNCIFIGLYFFEHFETIDDINKYDIPIHYCVTPTKVHEFKK